jgi:exopolysaccharide biosynthesis polyprenyl glycosylphosphotransferase
MADTRATTSHIEFPLPAPKPLVEELWVALPRRTLPVYDFLSMAVPPATSDLYLTTTQSPEKNCAFWGVIALFTVALINSYAGYGHNQNGKSLKSISLALKCYLATSCALLTTATLMGHGHMLSQPETLANLIVTPILLAWTRTAPWQFRPNGANPTTPHGPIVICYDRCEKSLERALIENQIAGRISGVFYLTTPVRVRSGLKAPELPSVALLHRTMQTNSIQDVVFVYHPKLEAIPANERQQTLSEILSYPARIWLAFNIENEVPALITNRSGSYKLVPLITDNLITSQNFTKRSFDIFAGLLLLLCSLPLFVFATILVSISGPGPIIYRQTRIGAHGREFKVLKFRTMQHEPAAPFKQTVPNDKRITRAGRFLRKTSLDEVLQLINVLKGEMSLVGPRPHAPETQVEGIGFEEAVKLYRLRHRVKPGITGLAQIRGQRGETPAIEALAERVASDLEYIETWSLWLDLWIILRTFPVILKQTNAY